MRDVYVTYEYIGDDERITKRKGYIYSTIYKDEGITRPTHIFNMAYDVRLKLVKDFNIENPDDIDCNTDILITYIREL